MIQGTYYKEWSSVLNREMEFKVYGSAGVPVLALPARGGRFYDWENNGMPDAIAQLLNEGKVQLFCADSIDGEAVLNGDAETGVTIMQLDEGLDTGDILYVQPVAIDPDMTSGELFDRVTAVGARVLCEVVPAIAAGTLIAQPQDHANACLAPMLNKEMAEFRLTESAAHIHNWVRGMNPWPGAWFITSGGKKLKVMECRAVEASGKAPGTVLATKPLTVACGEGAVQLLNVVPEGKKPMDGTAFAAGQRLKTGDIL